MESFEIHSYFKIHAFFLLLASIHSKMYGFNYKCLCSEQRNINIYKSILLEKYVVMNLIKKKLDRLKIGGVECLLIHRF